MRQASTTLTQAISAAFNDNDWHVASTAGFLSPHIYNICGLEIFDHSTSPLLTTPTKFGGGARGIAGPARVPPWVAPHAIGATVKELPYLRCYLANSSSPSVSPAFDASWTDVAGATRHELSETIGSSASTVTGTIAAGPATAHRLLLRQYVSDPLPDEAFKFDMDLLAGGLGSGFGLGIIRASRDHFTSPLAAIAYVVRVVSNDGITVRGTLIAASLGGSVSQPTLYPVASGSRPVPAINRQPGDRLVLEIGIAVTSSVSSARTATLEFGSSGSVYLVNGPTTRPSPVGQPWASFCWTPDISQSRENITAVYTRPKAPVHEPLVYQSPVIPNPPASTGTALNQMLGNSRKANQ